MEGGYLAPAQDRCESQKPACARQRSQGTASSKYRRSAPAGWLTRRVPCSTVPPPPVATFVLISSRLLPGVVVRGGTQRSLFGSLLLADATAKGILASPE